jgi:hypothetical protein
VTHVRLTLINADPLLLGESIKFIESGVRPAVESQPGNPGMSLQANLRWPARRSVRGGLRQLRVAQPGSP